MKIAVLGTGMVGRTLAARLAGLGHDVAVGTRDPGATLSHTGPDGMGNPPFGQWQAENLAVSLRTFAAAAAAAELVVTATAGNGVLGALQAAGAENLAGKVLIDVTNPLDFSAGFPPTLFVSSTDSLGEQIQRAFPSARVVKTLNTVNCLVMVDPSRVPGEHSVFVAGEDATAKDVARDLLGTFGWKDADVVDLGGIRAARGTEMYLPLWLSLLQVIGSGDFNINVVRA